MGPEVGVLHSPITNWSGCWRKKYVLIDTTLHILVGAEGCVRSWLWNHSVANAWSGSGMDSQRQLPVVVITDACLCLAGIPVWELEVDASRSVYSQGASRVNPMCDAVVQLLTQHHTVLLPKRMLPVLSPLGCLIFALVSVVVVGFEQSCFVFNWGSKSLPHICQNYDTCKLSHPEEGWFGSLRFFNIIFFLKPCFFKDFICF